MSDCVPNFDMEETVVMDYVKDLLFDKYHQFWESIEPTTKGFVKTEKKNGSDLKYILSSVIDFLAPMVSLLTYAYNQDREKLTWDDDGNPEFENIPMSEILNITIDDVQYLSTKGNQKEYDTMYLPWVEKHRELGLCSPEQLAEPFDMWVDGNKKQCLKIVKSVIDRLCLEKSKGANSYHDINIEAVLGCGGIKSKVAIIKGKGKKWLVRGPFMWNYDC